MKSAVGGVWAPCRVSPSRVGAPAGATIKYANARAGTTGRRMRDETPLLRFADMKGPVCARRAAGRKFPLNDMAINPNRGIGELRNGGVFYTLGRIVNIGIFDTWQEQLMGEEGMMRKPCKILVVDDEPDLEELVKQRLRREIRSGRYEFIFTRNGVEALECLNGDDEIDIVLTDINMPEMDGLTLLEQIPSVNPNLRCVIVSAYGDMKNIRTAMNRGAFDFLTKPIDFEDLRITIDRTLKHLAMLREALAARDKMMAEGSR